MESTQAYYQDPVVRERIAEYCGGQAADPTGFTCHHLNTFKLITEKGSYAEIAGLPTERFPEILSDGGDIMRSIWDRSAHLIHLDLDYVNFDTPTRYYTDPERCFDRMEPVFQIVAALFKEFEIPVLATMTGRGYHFTGRLPDDHGLAKELAALGSLEKTLAAKYAAEEARRGESVALKGRIFAGIGRLLEYLAHRVIQQAKRATHTPVFLTDVLVCRRARERESLSLDLSCYGDPLYLRTIRCPFSTHQKYRATDPGLIAAPAHSALLCIPRVDLPLANLLTIRQDFRRAANLAQEVSTAIPATGQGLARLIQDYRASRLCRFHEYFDESWQDEPGQWSSGYDRLDLTSLPACASLALRYPNDLLLRPSYIRTLALVLWRLGWHPKDVAGLIRSKYERDYGWKSLWYTHDAATRASFYVRLFCGLAADGTDELEEFSCDAYREKGLCSQEHCGHELALYAESLKGRI